MTFKTYDRVLVRNHDKEPWEADLFAREQPDENGGISYKTLSGDYYNCIKYEGNEKLLGKTDEPEPELQFGDHVQVKQNVANFWCRAVFLAYEHDNESHKYKCIPEGSTEYLSYAYCRKANW